MRRRPEHVVLLRTGRHMAVALDVLARTYPGCQVSVVATPGTLDTLTRAAVAPDDIFIYSARPRFDCWPLLTSGLFARLRWRGFDRVVVLWLDPDGGDRPNVTRAALLLAPGGFDAITPDGRLWRQSIGPFVRREAHRAAWSIGVALVLALALYLPAHLARLVRGRAAVGTLR